METINMDWMKCLMEDAEATLHENVLCVTDDVENKGYLLYRNLKKRIDYFLTQPAYIPKKRCGKCYPILTALKHCITKDVCKCLSYEALYRLLFEDDGRHLMYKDAYNFIKKLYMQQLGITDEKTLEISEQYKLSGCFHWAPFNSWYSLDPLWPKYMTIEDKNSFEERKKKEQLQELRERKKEARQKKLEQEEGCFPTHIHIKEFKLALEEKFGPLPKPNLKSQKQSQNHDFSKK